MDRIVRLLLSLLVIGSLGHEAAAQTPNQWPNPRLASVFPPGGKAGTTVEVSVQGTDIEQPESLWFSHPGLKASLVAEPTVDPKDPKKTPAMVKKDAPTAAKFNIAIDKAVPAGLYDVRVISEKGVSNPRVFVVGDQIEVLEKEPNNDIDQPQKIELGTTVSGSIANPTDVDYFSLTAKKGQRILIHVAGASIDSRINPEIAVFDLQNRRVAYTRALPNEDGLLDFTAPADGEFLIRLNQFTYTAGSGDYFYRMTVWPGPWVDVVYPPVVEPGKTSKVTVYGRGLPGGKVDPKAIVDGVTLETVEATINAPADANKLTIAGSITPLQGTLPGFEYRLGNSNLKFIPYAQAPVVIENDDNDTMEKAQKVTTPCEIVGRINTPRDRDWYSFDAKKGDVIMIDAISQRLGAPTDLFLKLVNAKKVELTMQDDTIETLGVRGYYTAGRDPQPYRFAVPEDGTYSILVGTHGNSAGPNHVYRVRLAPEKPDFQIVAMPADDYRPDSLNFGKGGIGDLNVFVQRQDGFKGDIALTVEGLPEGIVCPPQTMGGALKQTRLALVSTDKAPEKFEGTIKVIGSAVINGQKVVREARPASVTWGSANAQGTTPSIVRHDRAMIMALHGKAPLTVAAKKDRVVVLAGDKAEFPFTLSRLDPEFKGNFQVQVAQGELPTGITAANLTFAPGKDEQTLTLTTQPTVAPGSYNFVFRGNGKFAIGKGKDMTAIFPLYPVTLVVVPKQVGTLTLDKADATLKPGEEATVTLKLARQIPAELKVQLLPENAKDLTAEPISIAADKNEAKFVLKASDAAAAGPRANLTIRAVAVVEGITINHDVKMNVNVVKAK